MEKRSIFHTLLTYTLAFIMLPLLTFSLAFVSCNNGASDDGSGYQTLNLSGQVHRGFSMKRVEKTSVNYPQYNPGRQLTVYSNLGVTGSISATGQLSFSIATPDNQYLFPQAFVRDLLSNEFGYTNVSIAPEDTLFSYLELSCPDGHLSRQLHTGTVDSAGHGNGSDEVVVYVYVDKNVTLRIQGELTSGEDVFLNLKQGWNSIRHIDRWIHRESGNISNESLSVSNPNNFLWMVH